MMAMLTLMEANSKLIPNQTVTTEEVESTGTKPLSITIIQLQIRL